MSSTSNSIREKFTASKFAPFSHFLSIKKLSHLHYLGYRLDGFRWRKNALSDMMQRLPCTGGE